jgi:hypothetical protein
MATLNLMSRIPANVGRCPLPAPPGNTNTWTLVSATGLGPNGYFYLQLPGSNSVRYTYSPNMVISVQGDLVLDLQGLTDPVSVFNWVFTDYCDLGNPCGTTYPVTVTSKNNIASVVTTPLHTDIGGAVLDLTSGASTLITNGTYGTVKGYLYSENNILKLGYYLNYRDSASFYNDGFKSYTISSQPSWSTSISSIANTKTLNQLIFGQYTIPLSPTVDITASSEAQIIASIKNSYTNYFNTTYSGVPIVVVDMINGLTVTCTKSGTTTIGVSQKPFFTDASASCPQIISGSASLTATDSTVYSGSTTLNNGSSTINPSSQTTIFTACGSALVVDPGNTTFSVQASDQYTLNGIAGILPGRLGYLLPNGGSIFTTTNSNPSASYITCNVSATMQYNHNRGAAADLVNFKVTKVSNGAVQYNGASNSGVINYSSPDTFAIETTISTGVGGNCVLTKNVTI